MLRYATIQNWRCVIFYRFCWSRLDSKKYCMKNAHHHEKIAHAMMHYNLWCKPATYLHHLSSNILQLKYFKSTDIQHKPKKSVLLWNESELYPSIFFDDNQQFNSNAVSLLNLDRQIYRWRKTNLSSFCGKMKNIKE